MIRKDQYNFAIEPKGSVESTVEFKKEWSFYEVHNPKTIICEAQAISKSKRTKLDELFKRKRA